MTVRVDYTQLDQPPIVLTLEEVEPGGYTIIDQHGRHYTLCPVDLDWAIRFMLAMSAKGDAVIDHASVERVTWHSVRVLGEVPGVTGDDGTGTSPSNVIHLPRRETA